VLISIPFDGTSSRGKSVMALEEDGFLPAAFRNVQEIGKGLKSNGTSNIAAEFFCRETKYSTREHIRTSFVL